MRLSTLWYSIILTVVNEDTEDARDGTGKGQRGEERGEGESVARLSPYLLLLHTISRLVCGGLITSSLHAPSPE